MLIEQEENVMIFFLLVFLRRKMETILSSFQLLQQKFFQACFIRQLKHISGNE